VCDGDVCVALEEVIGQEHIDLVVVGTHSRMGLSKFIFGSVAERILRRVSTPVLTVGPKAAPDGEPQRREASRPLLFATDFSEASLRILPYAIPSPMNASRSLCYSMCCHRLRSRKGMVGTRHKTLRACRRKHNFRSGSVLKL
jgi:hypothetical protein